MRKTLSTIAVAGIASLAMTAAAQAAPSDLTTFDGFKDGTVNDQSGWKADANSAMHYDQSVTPVLGGKALRMSNAVTSGEFQYMPYSAPVDAAGEQANRVLTNEFTFKSATGERQPGLAMSVSPTDGEGARMSYVRLEDAQDGVRVYFNDTPYHDSAEFDSRLIATVGRDQHTIKFATKFVPGTNNDVVRVYIDGDLKACGTSWENYYRYGENHEPRTTDRLMWRLGGAAAPDTKGKGFLFDNVKSESATAGGPEGCDQVPADGQTASVGQNGRNGAPGLNGATGAPGQNGTTTILTREVPAHSAAKVCTGDNVRVLRAPSRKGERFLSARASLNGKALKVSGRKMTADLRHRAEGNYNVRISSRYRTAGGKVRTMHTVRSLSVACS
jgi:hypothetical protein